MKTIRNEKLTVEIHEKGAILHSIKDNDGCEYLWQGNPEYWKGQAPNLFPYIGRLIDGKYTWNGETYELARHGFARDYVWEVTQSSENKIIFTLQDTKETKTCYPAAFTFSITYTLEDAKLTILYSVKNEDNKTIYFGVGGHPGFNVPMEEGLAFEDYYLQFDEAASPKYVVLTETGFVSGEEREYEMEDGVKIPLKHDLFDQDAIVLKEMSKGVTLKSDKGSKALHVSFPDMDYVGFWHTPKTDAPFVCIEPWTSLPARDGVIEDFATQPSLISLEVGMTYKNKVEISVR